MEAHKFYLAAFVAIVALASCTKQEQVEIQPVSNSKTFVAVIEQGLTKTILTEDYKIYWLPGDRLNINGAEYAASPKDSASEAVFQFVSGPDVTEGHYKAIYPASLYSVGRGGFEFPSTLTCKEGELNTPMYAESDNEELYFRNISGVLHLALTGYEGTEVVKKITVKANEPITGPFSVTISSDGILDLNFEGKGKTLTMDCGEGISLDSTKNLYIPLPEGYYTAGLTVTIENEDGEKFERTTGNNVNIDRNYVYSSEWEVCFALPTLDDVYKQMALLIGSKQPGKEYNPYRTLYNMCGDDVCAADAYENGYAYIAQLNDFTYDANNEVIYNCYTNFYKAIDVCNMFLSRYCNEDGTELDTVKTKNLDLETVQNEWAQVRTLRAWLHVTLAEGWGNPPIVDTYPAPENPGNIEKAKIYRWIEDEIESVFKGGALEERKGQRDKDGVTKVTKGFAQALLGKVYLFDGKPASAAEWLKPLVESSHYALVPGNRFFDLFHIEGNGCEEKIFELDMSKVSEYPYAGTETKLWACNDKCFVTSPWKGGQASESAWGLGPNADYALAFLANDGDSYRRKVVFLTSDEVFYDEGLTSYGIDYGATLEEKQFSPLIGIKTEGLYGQSDVIPRKLIVNRTDAASGSNMTNFTVMRLGEAYLLYAEACVNAGSPQEALKYVNSIQQRAGSKTSGYVDMDVIKAEKKYELWMEGCRWADIVRWGDLNKVAAAGTQVPKAVDEYTTSEGDEFRKPHKLRYELVNVKSTGSFNSEKHTRFPYPAAVVSRNKNLTQNPGW